MAPGGAVILRQGDPGNHPSQLTGAPLLQPGTPGTMALDGAACMWPSKHIQGSDQKYRSHLNAKGIN
jgi:hypothetical protein